MAILLDDRYVLLAERRIGWLERSYDGWDRQEDRPITAGWMASLEPLPIMPVTIRLRHPAILSLLDLRIQTGEGTWAIWEHFGEAGSEALTGQPMGHRMTAWILHESVGALTYARDALARPGGFRIGDFSPDMIRLYGDGRVRVAGFGRMAAEASQTNEFARLAAWAGEWLAHGHDAESPAGTEATVEAELVDALGRLQTADHQYQSAIPRITSGLRVHLEGGESELALWMSGREFDARPATGIAELYQQYLRTPGPSHEIDTVSLESVEAERAAVDLPRVRIAPIQKEPDAEAAKLHKGLPIQPRDHLPWLLAGIAVLMIVFGSLAFRPWSESPQDAQRYQAWLETVPAGASVYVDDSLRSGKTPLGLDGLTMGWHRVRFEKQEFSPLEDSILIYKHDTHRPFKFVFVRPLKVESQPPGAVVYLNGRRASRPTPSEESDWPATQVISVVMHLEQYGSLEDCVVDPMYGTLEVKDPAAWQVRRAGDTLVVSGLFVSTVSFFASPADCQIRIDDTLPVDPTGAVSYTLTYGQHRLQAQAVGFDALDTTILISGRTEKLLPVVLSRPVRIFAFDPGDRHNDLRVLVDRLEGPERSLLVRRFTPYSVRVPAVAHTVTLSKRDYLDTTVYIPPDVTQVSVAMRRGSSRSSPLPVAPRTEEAEAADRPAPTERSVPTPDPGSPWITVAVSAPGRTHLAGAEIWVRATGEPTEEWIGTTDEKGELRVQLPAGNYDFLAYLDAYSGVRKRLKIRSDRNRPVIVELRR